MKMGVDVKAKERSGLKGERGGGVYSDYGEKRH
jgi:hypothetical protein